MGSGTLAALAGCGYRPGGGDIRWRSDDLRGLFRASRVDVAGGVVYTIARRDTSFDLDAEEFRHGGRVTAYATTNGNRRWSTSFETSLSASTVGDGGAAVAFDGTVVRLGPGGRAWSATVDGDPVSMAVADERVYARIAGRRIVALAGGERVGEISIDGAEHGVVDATEDLVVTADETGVAAFDADGTRRWRRDDVAVTELTVAPSGVYAVTDRRLLALERSTGDTRWRTGPRGVAPAPVVTADSVYYCPRSLVALDHAGERRWTADVTDVVDDGPPVAVDDSGVYAASRSRLTALDHDGTRRWTVEHGEVTAGPFLVDAGVLVVDGDDLVCHVR